MFIKNVMESKKVSLCLLFVSFIPLLAKIIFDWNSFVHCLQSDFGQDVYFLKLLPLVLLPACAAIFALYRNKTITILEDDDEKKFLLAFIFFLFGLTITAVVAYCWKVSAPPLTPDDFFTGGKDGGVKPEPRECHAFIFTAILSPFIALASLCFATKLFASRIGQFMLNVAIPVVWLSLFVMSYIFINSFNAHAGGSDKLILGIPSLFMLSFVLAFFVLFLRIPVFKECDSRRCCICFVVFSILYLFLYFMGDFFVTVSSPALQDENNQIHTGLMAYPVAQAISGIYETHQYGNYYRMITWFVNLWSPGYRINAMLLFFGIISAIQIWLLFWIVYRLLNRKILAFLFVCSWGVVCSMEYFIVKDTYFGFPRLLLQYMPIRTLYAILSIVFTYSWLNAKGKKTYLLFVIGLLGGSAIFWNFDTGLVVLGATAAIVCAELIRIKTPLLGQAKWGCSIQFRKLLLWGAGVVSAAVIIECWFSFQQHSFFHPFAFTFQSMFYQSGFCMLPMPPPYAGMWWAMLLVYALGMLLGIRGYFSDEWSLRSKMSLFLSLLGIGLFSYYQGRSHICTLVLVSYPSVILLLMYMDGITEYCEKKSNVNSLYKAIRALCLWGILTLVIASAVLVPIHALRAYKIFTNTAPASSVAQEKIKFILEKANGRKSINIMGDSSQGFYHLATETNCSIPQANYTEFVILKQDVERVFQSLKNTSDPLFCKIPSNNPDFSDAIKAEVLPYYTLKGHCGDLYYFEKKVERGESIPAQ